VTHAVARVLRADLVWMTTGLRPVAHEAAEGLHRLVDAACEQRSIATSWNLHPASFDELVTKTLATSTGSCTVHTSVRRPATVSA